ncbi:porin family protein [Tellurirhabdus rosea]|uniref:porin family protein n=1 Tax=Tellurirhabdus rosea TaxID=2674997 RepID=UPI00224D34F3|nr:porin family protein [Tellurirhabdus rosea]
MKKVAALSLILGLLVGMETMAQVTVQKRRSSPPVAQPETRPETSSRRRSNVETPRNRTADRVFRRIEEEEGPDYARPTKLVEMSIRVAPSLMLNTAEGTGDYTGFAPNGAGVRMSVGPTLDYFFFKDRYAFSSGLWYTIKRSAYQIPGSYGTGRWIPGASPKESVYNLQYLQIPASVKMYANNLFPDLRLYVQTGGVLDIKLAEKPQNIALNRLYQVAEQNGGRRQYSRGDIGLLLGAGVQYRLNGSQAIIMGVSYQRGLTDVARGRNLVSYNRVVALEVGLKF